MVEIKLKLSLKLPSFGRIEINSPDFGTNRISFKIYFTLELDRTHLKVHQKGGFQQSDFLAVSVTAASTHSQQHLNSGVSILCYHFIQYYNYTKLFTILLSTNVSLYPSIVYDFISLHSRGIYGRGEGGYMAAIVSFVGTTQYWPHPPLHCHKGDMEK